MFKKSSHKKLIHCALLLGIMSTFGFDSFADNIPVPTGDEIESNLEVPDWKNISNPNTPYWVCNIRGSITKDNHTWNVGLQLSSAGEKPKQISAAEIQVSDIKATEQLQIHRPDRALSAFYTIKINNKRTEQPLVLNLTNVNIPKSCHTKATDEFTGFADC